METWESYLFYWIENIIEGVHLFTENIYNLALIIQSKGILLTINCIKIIAIRHINKVSKMLALFNCHE